MFPYDEMGLRIPQKVALSVHHVRGHRISICLHSGNVTLNYLVKVVSAGTPHFFFFTISSKYLRGKYFKTVVPPILLTNSGIH